MAIFKNQQKTDFVMIPNEMLVDERLTWKAKGVLCYLLSMPYDWKVYTEEIETHSKDGIDSLVTAINELMNLGYIQRTKLRGEKGRFGGYEYNVFNTPTITDISKNGESENGLSKNGKSNTTNTNLTKKNLTKKNKTKKEVYISMLRDENMFFKVYDFFYHQKFNKPHLKVTTTDYDLLTDWVADLANYGIGKEDWTRAVSEHFDNLPKSNNGSIIAFMSASFRYFEVNPPKQRSVL